MIIDFSIYYVSFNSLIEQDIDVKVLVINELEEALEGLGHSEAYNRLREKILKYKTMVNAQLEFLGIEKKYELESNPFLEAICELELDNKLLKYMGRAMIDELFKAKKIQEKDKDYILTGFKGKMKGDNAAGEEAVIKNPYELTAKRLRKENNRLRDLIKGITKEFGIEKSRSKEHAGERQRTAK